MLAGASAYFFLTGALAAVATNGARAAVLIGLPICIGFITLGERFIGLWMGAEYAAPAGQVLMFLAVGHLVGVPYYTISGVLYGLGRHHVVAYSRLFEGAVNLALSVLLIKRYGLAGVAIGTAVPQIIVAAGILPFVLSKWVSINLRDYYLTTYVRPFAAALPFLATCWWIDQVLRPATFVSFFAAGAASLVAYVVPCWLLVFSADERATLVDALARRLPRRRTVEGLT